MISSSCLLNVHVTFLRGWVSSGSRFISLLSYLKCSSKESTNFNNERVKNIVNAVTYYIFNHLPRISWLWPHYKGFSVPGIYDVIFRTDVPHHGHPRNPARE